MAPRKKKDDAPQFDIKPGNPDAMIEEYFKLKGHFEAQQESFKNAMMPCTTRIEEIRRSLHAMAIEQKVKSYKTDHGTAYLSEITSHKIDPVAGAPFTNPETGEVSTGRDALLDWGLANWAEFGNDGLQINVSAAAVEKWRAQHDGAPPPGLVLSTELRLNIRKS